MSNTRILPMPDICQSCATGHARLECMWFPVPCADRMELWLSGRTTGLQHACKLIDDEALLHECTDEALADSLRAVSRRIAGAS